MDWLHYYSNPVVTKTQLAALIHVIRESDAAGEAVAIFGWRLSTLNRLETLGLIKCRRVFTERETFRRGAYGRRIGGTKTFTTCTFYCQPTAKGREAAEGQ